MPAGAAAKFEAAFRAALPDAFASQPDLLFQLVTMLSPRVLREYGVPVYSATQVRHITAPGTAPLFPYRMPACLWPRGVVPCRACWERFLIDTENITRS